MVPGLAQLVTDLVAGGQGVGVVGAQDPLPVGQQRPVGGQGTQVVPGLAQLVSDLVAGGQGVGVVGAQDPLLVGQQRR